MPDGRQDMIMCKLREYNQSNKGTANPKHHTKLAFHVFIFYGGENKLLPAMLLFTFEIQDCYL